MLYIVDAELIEGNYVLYQGDLSTSGVGKAQGVGFSSEEFRKIVAVPLNK
ncbi:hypothetical protein NCCP436_24930 [Pseudomonas sp. NCCP-436]|nr:hypothetical protein NCCP436_24930 [Pseudomonas sp. NCCP-436]